MRRIIAGINDLATINPTLAAEWHPTKNGSITSNQVGSGVRTCYWWLGKCGHEWEDGVFRRNNGIGCPYCFGSKLLTGFNDFATVYPILAAEWHPTKNTELTPDQIINNSSRKIWWLGNCGHEWVAQINERTQGENNCNYCSGRKLLVGFNDLATTNPHLASEWHPTKNILTAEQVTGKSTKKIWWLGKCGHEWNAVLYNRNSSRKSGCPVCSGFKVLAGFNDLASKMPELAAEWHPTKNNLSPYETALMSNEKAWWKCETGHEWEAVVSGRTGKKYGCPICSGKRVLSGFNDLATRNPVLAAQWHPTKNTFLVTEVTAFTPRKAWWKCERGHEWEATILGRSYGVNCAVCSNKKVLAGFNDLATTDPILAAEWHPTKNGNLTAQEVTRGSNTKVWWLGKCGHSWLTPLFDRNGCSVCHGSTIEIGANDLATVDPKLASQWHPSKNGNLTAQQVTRGSKTNVWWLGECGHEWESSPKARSRGQSCHQCSNNVSQAEKDIQEFLVSLGVTVEASNRTILKNRKELDLWIPERKVAIEFNGIHWHKEKYHNKDAHYDKWLACHMLGVQLIQIWEDDWNSNSEMIKKSLAHNLGIVDMNDLLEDSITVSSITPRQAEDFLNKNSLQNFSSGHYYLGLSEKERN